MITMEVEDTGYPQRPPARPSVRKKTLNNMSYKRTITQSCEKMSELKTSDYIVIGLVIISVLTSVYSLTRISPIQKATNAISDSVDALSTQLSDNDDALASVTSGLNTITSGINDVLAELGKEPVPTPAPTPAPTTTFWRANDNSLHYPQFNSDGSVNAYPDISKAPDADEFAGQTIKILARDTKATHETLRRFELMYPDVKVDANIVSGAVVGEKMKIAMAVSADYDVFYTNIGSTATYWRIYLQPIDKYIEQEGGDDYTGQYNHLLHTMADGYSYAIPTRLWNMILYYNEKMLTDAGLTIEDCLTYEAIIRNTPKLNKDTDGDGVLDVYTMIQGWGAPYWMMNDFFSQVTYQVGGQLWDSNTYLPLYNNTHGEYTLGLMKQMFDEKTLAPDSLVANPKDASALMAAGKGVFLLDFAGFMSTFEDPEKSQVVGQIKTFIKPGVEFTGEPLLEKLPSYDGTPPYRSVTNWGDRGLTITKYSKNPDLAWRFIRIYTSPSLVKFECLEDGAIPTMKRLYDDPEVMAVIGADAAANAEQIKYPTRLHTDAALGAMTEQWIPRIEQYQNWLTAAILGEVSVHDALQRAALENVELMPD